MQYLKFLFIGGPGTGKTTTRDRLVGEYVNLETRPSDLHLKPDSTGVTHMSECFKMDATTPYGVSQSGRKILSLVNYDTHNESATSAKSMDPRSFIQLLHELIIQESQPPEPSAPKRTPSVPKSPVTTSTLKPSVDTKPPTTSELVEAHVKPPTGSVPQTQSVAKVNYNELSTTTTLTADESSPGYQEDAFKDVNDAFKKLTGITSSQKHKDIHKVMQEMQSIIINLCDCGGQKFFQEILPALTIGHALYLVFFRLDKTLSMTEPISVIFLTDGKEIPLNESYTSLEMILQGLSSIQCFGSCIDPDTEQKYQSKALLIGTFKDDCKTSEMDVHSSLKTELEVTKLLTLVCYNEEIPESKVFFPLENMSGGVDELDELHDTLMSIVEDKQCFPQYKIPAPWLIFRMIIHLMHKPIVTSSECEEIANRLHMQDTLETALWFFTKKVGSLMQYKEKDVPSMENKIICSPQVIFDSISKLIVENSLRPTRNLKGQFSLSAIQPITNPEGRILTAEELVEILEHLGIIAKVNDGVQEETRATSESDSNFACEGPRYILPAMLPCASDADLKPKEILPEKISCPLIIEFDCGHVPLGIFCTAIARLIRFQCEMEWKLVNSVSKYKNKFVFRLERAFDITLVAKSKYIQVQIENCGSTDILLSAACFKVRHTLSRTLEHLLRGSKSPFYFSNSKTQFYFSFFLHLF